MRARWFVLVYVGAILVLGCGPVRGAETPPQPTIPLPPELARILTDYEVAWRAKDEKALAALFAEDGFVLSSGMPPVRGRKQIEHRYKDSGGPLSLRALAFATEGSAGYIIGGFTRNSGDPDIGKFTLTLRKEPDGRWMIMSDMDNGNQRKQAPSNDPQGGNEQITVPENTAHYLEIVTPDVEAACRHYGTAYGWNFEAMGPELGNSFVAKLADGSLCGIRAPMHEQENPVVRTYIRVADVEAAAKEAEKLGAVIALEPTEIPGHGKICIYLYGGIEQGLWQVP